MDLPFVSLPGSFLKYLIFHLKEVLPILDTYRTGDKNHTKKDKQYADCSLLLHCKTGVRLRESQILSSWKSFVKNIDKSLEGMTIRELPISYATLMTHSFREGKFMPDSEERQFLAHLASSMNTSVDMLKSAYIGLSTEDYLSMAQKIADGLDRFLDEDVEDGEALEREQERNREHEASFFST